MTITPGLFKSVANAGRSLKGQLTQAARLGAATTVTVSADGQGNVVAFWHVMAEPKPEVKAPARADLQGDLDHSYATRLY